jgi:hypothetical protein
LRSFLTSTGVLISLPGSNSFFRRDDDDFDLAFPISERRHRLFELNATATEIRMLYSIKNE